MTTKMFGSLLSAAIACAALLAAGVGRAEDYPARPIKLIIPFAAGATLKEDEVKQRLADVGTDPGGAAGVEAERIIVEDAARWTDVVKKSGVRVQ